MEIEEIRLSSLEIKDNEKKEPSVVDIDCNYDEKVNEIRRSMRKKIKPLQAVEKRRILSKPKKLDENTIKDIENYYLDKRIKSSSSSLETIFEEPKNGTTMSIRKWRRYIQFSDIISETQNKVKLKKRSMKAKKIIKSDLKKSIKKKLSLDLLMDKLKGLDNIN